MCSLIVMVLPVQSEISNPEQFECCMVLDGESDPLQRRRREIFGRELRHRPEEEPVGQVLPVRITESEVIVYSTGLEEIARHPHVSGTQTSVRRLIKSHHPADDPGQRTLLLQQRFGELGPIALQFLDGLLAKQIQGKLQAQQLLALLAQYQRGDVLKALERAVRFGAYSLAAMRRILAAIAKPKPLLDELAELYKDALDPSLREEPIGPRPTSDYQHLLSPEETDEPPSEEKSPDDIECA